MYIAVLTNHQVSVLESVLAKIIDHLLPKF